MLVSSQETLKVPGREKESNPVYISIMSNIMAPSAVRKQNLRSPFFYKFLQHPGSYQI